MAFSDLHHSRERARALVEAAAPADLVIAAGDFCNARRDLDVALGLLSDISAPIIAVPGNAESADELRIAAPRNMRVLHGEVAMADGLRIFGLGYAVPETPFGDCSCDLSEAEAETLLAEADGADIMVLHAPPKGVADETSAGDSVGSTAIRAAIERVQPELAVCGHIHDSWGKSGLIGRTRILNLGPTANWFEVGP